MIESFFPWQLRALGVPLEYDGGYFGGRIGGKSTLAIAQGVRMALSRPKSRSAYFRQTQASLDDVVENSIDIVPFIDPAAQLKMSDPPVWKFTNGSSLTFAPLADVKLYRRWQGANLDGCAIFDECQQWPDSKLPDRILSNLRNTDGLPTPAYYCANPGDFQYWIYERMIKPCPGDGIPFKLINGREAVVFRTTLEDNPLAPKNYADTLLASAGDDIVLARSWIDGDWSRIGGAYFSEVLGDKNVVRWFPGDWFPDRADWRFFLAYDFGIAAPAVCLLVALAKDHTTGADGFEYVRGDKVVIDEYHTAVPHDLNKGDGSTVSQQAEGIKAMCARWQVAPYGCGDDSIFARRGDEIGTTAKEFQQNGVTFEGAGKMKRNETTGKTARVSGWSLLKNRMNAARVPGQRDRPAFYFNAHACPYTWETLRMLVPDSKNREDLQTDGQPEHSADCCRYAAIWSPPPPASTEPFPF